MIRTQISLRRIQNAAKAQSEQVGQLQTDVEALQESDEQINQSVEQLQEFDQQKEIVIENLQTRLEQVEIELTGLQNEIGKILQRRPIEMIGSGDLAHFDIGTGLGSAIWEDYALCDGRNGTEDLSGKFIVGFNPQPTANTTEEDYADIGNTGGEEFTELTVANLPPHNHDNGDYNLLLRLDENRGKSAEGINGAADEPDVVNGGEILEVGDGEPVDNRPPYYVLAFVRRIA